MQVKDITDFLEQIAPLELQESYDNSGLITGHSDHEVKAVLCTLDCTEEVVNEAIEKDCNMIVAHHPIVFSGLKKINGHTYVERTIIQAIKHDIAIYAIHTNLDNVLSHGVNERIAQRLGLSDYKILRPLQNDHNLGSGVIGRWPNPLSPVTALDHIKNLMELTMIRHTALPEESREIQTIALCGGSGSFLLEEAKKQKANIFITADFKYHQFFDAEDEIIIADIGHYESEKYTINLLVDLIQNKFSNFAVYFSEVDTNPVRYFY